MTNQELLNELNFGSGVAENERSELHEFFVRTNQYERFLSGEIDLVYGPKGSGKSALYLSLESESARLRDERNIKVILAENPTGNAVFSSLKLGSEIGEVEFRSLWELYILVLLGNMLKEEKVNNQASRDLVRELEDMKLLTPDKSLLSIFRRCVDFIRSLRPKAVEVGLKINPMSQLPEGFTGKMEFEKEKESIHDFDTLLDMADAGLRDSSLDAWIAFDRLDVAFEGSQNLEVRALRSLFRTYLNFGQYSNIHLKIFLRSDIWQRILNEEFREATHLTKETRLEWSRAMLLNLAIRRALRNNSIAVHFGIDTARVLSSTDEQEKLLYKIFPSKIESGQKQSSTFDWMLLRLSDGKKNGRAGELNVTPRDLIQLLAESVKIQQKMDGVGQPNIGGALIDRNAVKEAYKIVSETKLYKSLLAEYPLYKQAIEALKGQKADQTIDSLGQLWMGVSAGTVIDKLVELGFFDETIRDGKKWFTITRIYRPALGIILGKAKGAARPKPAFLSDGAETQQEPLVHTLPASMLGTDPLSMLRKIPSQDVQQAIERYVAAGEELHVSQSILSKIDLPDELRRLSDTMGGIQEIRVARPPIPLPYAHTLIFEPVLGNPVQIETINMSIIRAGTEEILLSNELDAQCPFFLSLLVNFKNQVTTLHFRSKIMKARISQVFEALSFMVSLSDGHGLLKLRNKETGRDEIVGNAPTLSIPDQLREFKTVLEDLLLIQQKSGAVLSLPDTSLTYEQVSEIERVATIMRTGKYSAELENVTMPTSSDLLAAGMPNLDWSKELSARLEQEGETAIILGVPIRLGAVQITIPRAKLDEKDRPFYEAAKSKSDVPIDLHLIPIDGVPAQFVYPDWSIDEQEANSAS